MKINKFRTIVISIIVIVFLTAGFIFKKDDDFFEIAKNIDIFTRVYKEIAFGYVDGVNPEEFLRAGIRGMLNTLDPYTVFIDEKKQEDIDLITNGRYGGIGVTIGIRDDNVSIMEIMDGYSAQKQGLSIGDIITDVNGIKISPKNIDDVGSLVKGEPGTFVKLHVLRAGVLDTLSFELPREEIKLKNIIYSGFYPETGNIAYIKLTSFSRSGGEELKNVLLDLKRQKNIEGIILDLRNNPGGLLDVAADVANKFLAKGQLIVATRGRDSASLKQYFSSQEPLLKDSKLVVLVNEGSASASEIVAGAIQDHDRGVILGQKSFGKGLVQTIIPLSYNTSLKVTTAKYFTPSGRCIQKINYSKDNKVFTEVDSLNTIPFQTDRNRTVFSSGGILPDSIVDTNEDPALIRDMLAKGLFFKFVNRLQTDAPKEKLEKYSGTELFELLMKYLKQEKYTFVSDVEKKLEDITKLASKQKQYIKLSSNLLDLQEQARIIANSDFNKSRVEILSEVQVEIASRLRGSSGRIKETMKSDHQLNIAVDVLENESVYNKLLKGTK